VETHDESFVNTLRNSGWISDSIQPFKDYSRGSCRREVERRQFLEQPILAVDGAVMALSVTRASSPYFASVRPMPQYS
jgi:hypothetical protein